MNTTTNNQYSSLSDHHQTATFKYLKNWIELDANAIEHNAQQFKQWLGTKTEIAAVIKSNAYGHGIVEMAQIYEHCKSIKALCVVNLSEAVLIKEQTNITKPIFIIGYLDQSYDFIIKYDLQVALYDAALAQELNETGKRHQKKIKVHIKVDTGMSRLGIVRSELNDFITQTSTLSWISIVGIFTHFAESYSKTRTHEQEAVFAYTEQFSYQTHSSNSHGALTIASKNYNFARIGIGLYGYLEKESLENRAKLQPVLSLKTKILQIKSIKKGTCVGYDGMFQAPTDMIIATIAIGYHEGLDARLSNQGSVMIHGQFAPIVGRICMNLTMVDISNIPDCFVGQTVTVLGKDGNISISGYDWSSITKASVYNHLTKLSAMVPRIIV